MTNPANWNALRSDVSAFDSGEVALCNGESFGQLALCDVPGQAKVSKFSRLTCRPNGSHLVQDLFCHGRGLIRFVLIRQ